LGKIKLFSLYPQIALDSCLWINILIIISKKGRSIFKIQDPDMTEEQIFSFPNGQMFEEDDFSEFDDPELGKEEGDEEGFDDEEMLDEEKIDWEEEM